MKRYSKFSPKHAFAAAIVYGARDRNKRKNNDPAVFTELSSLTKLFLFLGNPTVLVITLFLWPKMFFILLLCTWLPMIIICKIHK